MEPREWTPGCLVRCIDGHNRGAIGIMLELCFVGSGEGDYMDVVTGSGSIRVHPHYWELVFKS